MAGRVFALLVGINDYGGKPTSLQGCVPDMHVWDALLCGRVAEADLCLEMLLDGHATCQAVIDAFERHLGQAGPGDVALFAFSGHGSTELVEDRFWFLEPTGENQTIVCADSRTKRAGDLADKELNELIQHVSAKGPHVVVILDCCHSGGGSRDPVLPSDDVRARLAPPEAGRRPLESYLPGVRAAAEATTTPATSPAGQQGAAPAHPRHVALMACGPMQLSKEIGTAAAARGAFSSALERALTTMPDTVTYRQLISAASNAVRNRVLDQDPMVFVEGEALDQQFLGGAVLPRPATITLQREGTGWSIDVGSVHGIQPPRDGTTTMLAVLGVVGSPRPATRLGVVNVSNVDAVRSTVDTTGIELDESSRDDVAVLSVPEPLAVVELRGDARGVELVRTALAGSATVREAQAGDADDRHRFCVVADDDGLTVCRADLTPLTDTVVTDPSGAARVVGRLEHLARWHQIRDLVNPSSALSGQVEIEIVEARPRRATGAPGRAPGHPCRRDRHRQAPLRAHGDRLDQPVRLHVRAQPQPGNAALRASRPRRPVRLPREAVTRPSDRARGDGGRLWRPPDRAIGAEGSHRGRWHASRRLAAAHRQPATDRGW